MPSRAGAAAVEMRDQHLSRRKFQSHRRVQAPRRGSTNSANIVFQQGMTDACSVSNALLRKAGGCYSLKMGAGLLVRVAAESSVGSKIKWVK